MLFVLCSFSSGASIFPHHIFRHRKFIYSGTHEKYSGAVWKYSGTGEVVGRSSEEKVVWVASSPFSCATSDELVASLLLCYMK